MHRYTNLLELSKQSVKRRLLEKPDSNITIKKFKTQTECLNELNAELNLPIPTQSLNLNNRANVDELNLSASTISLNLNDRTSDVESTNESVEYHVIDELLDDCIEKFLQEWALEYNVNHNCLNSLLSFLKNDYPFLPKDARTLLKTPQTREVIDISNGKYAHIGVENNLKMYLNNLKSNEVPEELLIDFNIDGLPNSKSSNSCFWLILGRIVKAKEFGIFTVGIYHGYSKPENFEEFLNPMVDEMLTLMQSYEHNGKQIKIKIRLFVCDAPARAACTGVKGHTGYHSCHKCTIEGEYVHNKVTFSGCGVLRTDASFRNRIDEEHHVKNSPLEKLQIDMVAQFPHDYLHVILLGNMRKLIRMWIGGRTIITKP